MKPDRSATLRRRNFLVGLSVAAIAVLSYTAFMMKVAGTGLL